MAIKSWDIQGGKHKLYGCVRINNYRSGNLCRFQHRTMKIMGKSAQKRSLDKTSSKLYLCYAAVPIECAMLQPILNDWIF